MKKYTLLCSLKHLALLYILYSPAFNKDMMDWMLLAPCPYPLSLTPVCASMPQPCAKGAQLSPSVENFPEPKSPGYHSLLTPGPYLKVRLALWGIVSSRASPGIRLKLVFSWDHILAWPCALAVSCFPHVPGAKGTLPMNHLSLFPHLGTQRFRA